MELSERQTEIRLLGGKVAAVSVDPPDKSRVMAKEYEIPFPLLGDPRLAVTASYGVVDSEGELALPAVFIIDAESRIRWRVIGESITARPGGERIVAALKQIRGQ